MKSTTPTLPHPQAEARWQAGLRAEKKQRWSTAEREYTLLTQLMPQHMEAWTRLTMVRARQGHYGGAQEAARQAFLLAPDNAQACRLWAATLSDQNKHEEALQALGMLPAHVPRDIDFQTALVHGLIRAQRWTEVIGPCMEMLKADMYNATVHLYLGLAFKSLKRHTDAGICFETAVITDRSGLVRPRALVHVVEQMHFSAQWDKLPAHTQAMNEALRTAPDSALTQLAPFPMLGMNCPSDVLLRIARNATESLCRGVEPLPAAGPRRPGPLRIAYLSNDFYAHATALLMAQMLERHRDGPFEIHLYCHSRHDDSPLQHRVRAAAHVFRDIRNLSDIDVARLMREDGIDIAIDLKGFTNSSRFHLLAHRPAPIQVSFLGFPGSTGAPFMDYVIGDPTVTPIAHADHFSERIAQMPICYQPNDQQRPLPPAPTRAALGLPDDAVVLCCFNQTYKILPDTADLWARILQGAPNAVLWLLIWTEDSARNLVHELQQRGVPPERVFFSPTADVTAHQARLQCADLFLDTLPYNAHTTGSDALWAGVPVLTLPGPTFASRVAASLVKACELPQLVCADGEDYVRKAVALAQNPSELQALKQHLIAQRTTLPLFDSERFTRDFEALLLRMWERHEAGLPPAHLPAQDDSHKTVTQVEPAAAALA